MTDTYDDDNWPRLLGELGLTEEEEGAAVALLVNKDAAYRKGMLWSHSLAVSRRAILGTLKALGELRPSLCCGSLSLGLLYLPVLPLALPNQGFTFILCVCPGTSGLAVAPIGAWVTTSPWIHHSDLCPNC